MDYSSAKAGLKLKLKKPIYIIAYGVIGILFCFAAITSQAQAGERTVAIKSQPLYSALSQFAEQSGIQFVYDAALVKGLSAPSVTKTENPHQALSELLKNSGLSYRFTDPKTVVLFRQEARYDSTSPNNAYLLPVAQVTGDKPKGDETTLPKVTVEADAEYDPEYYADPYNQDYVIPNATSGTKTNTPIMETPLNVQVISKQVLKDRQVISLDQALKNVSGVTSSFNSSSATYTGGLNQTFALRGFESRTIFRNGFRLQDATNNREMANIESVEVLKGPAAILYGQIEPGGMVNVTAKQPLATPYYGFNQQFGSYDLYRTTFDATGPLTKNKDLL